MPPSPAQLDFAPLLHDLLHAPASTGTGFTLGQRGASHPIAEFPLAADLEAAAERYGAMFGNVPGGLGSLKPIGRAHIDTDGLIHTNDQPWAFQAWVPFASKRVVQLEGTLLTVHVEVVAGEVDLGILAEDGSTLLGDRYRADAGEHEIQLTIPGNEVKGLVVCNCGPEAQVSHVRLLDVTLRQFDPTSEAAVAWGEALVAAEGQPPGETDDPADLTPTAPLVLFHLLRTGRFHDAKLLLHAADQLLGHTPTWCTERLANFLTEFLRQSDFTPTLRPSADDDGSAAAPPDHPLLDEWEKLRPAWGGQDLVPLHYELLETALLLDLLGTARSQATHFHWERAAVAATPVARGLLTQLLRVLTERLGGDLSDFAIEATTTPERTRVSIRSGLQHGDLQYRHFSRAVFELLRAANAPLGTAPELVHDLGAENHLVLDWPQQAPAAEMPPLESATPAAEAPSLYTGETGSRVLVQRGLCYKYTPADGDKRRTVPEEAALLATLADLGTSPIITALDEQDDGGWMSYRCRPGRPLSELSTTLTSPTDRAALIRSVSDLVTLVNQHGIQHRDLRAENFLIGPDESLTLLDYDQAERSPHADDFGNEWDDERACAGLGGLLQQLGWQEDFLRSAGAMGLVWELGRSAAANSPGKHACYYNWQWGPLHLSGERPWATRWQLFQPVFAETEPGRFLELGCNLGLLATYAALSGWTARGVDHDGVAVAGANLLAGTLGADAQFTTMDLTDTTAWAGIEGEFDLVSCLSVAHWLPDAALLEDFLRRQPRLLFEGHRSVSEEKDYLHSLGFTSVALLGYSERLRPVLLAERKS